MTGWLGLDEAELLLVEHLGSTPRAGHSRFVGALMGQLAQRCDGDPALWQVTGLVHDIDYPATAATPERHGPMTVEWLAGRLPVDALLAIASHDHRSGITSDTPIADALKLADAIAVLDERAGREAVLAAAEQGADGMRQLAGDRGYLAEMVLRFSVRLGLSLTAAAGALRAAPLQIT